MNKSNGNKILLVIIAFLIVTNLVVVGLWWSATHKEKMPSKRDSPMAEYLKQDLGFTAIQLRKFDTIKAQQRTDAKELFGKIKNEKTTIYRQLAAGDFSDSALAVAADFSSQKQRKLETMMLMHLREIRNLCNPEQLVKFDSGFYKVMTKGGMHGSDSKKPGSK